MTTRCCFCATDQGSSRLLQHRIGWENEHFYVTPTVGEIGDTHSLLIPWLHIPSFSHLPSELSVQAENIVDEHCRLLSNEDTKVVIFEHGMSSHSAAGGCGISHAHIHLVAVSRSLQIDPLPRPDNRHSWVTAPAEGYLRRTVGSNGYLLIGCEGVFRMREVADLPSQYLRRWLAALVGGLQWDWRKFDDASLGSRAQSLRQRYAISNH